MTEQLRELIRDINVTILAGDEEEAGLLGLTEADETELIEMQQDQKDLGITDAQVMEHGVAMAQAWKKGGKAALREKMRELFPDAATSTAKPTQ